VSGWKGDFLPLIREFFVYFLVWFFLFIFLGTIGPIATFYPQNSWEIVKIEVYFKDLLNAALGVTIVYFLAKAYRVFEKRKTEIYQELNIKEIFFVDTLIPLVLIGFAWYILCGGSNIIKEFDYISQSNFPFFGSFILVASAIFKIEVKTAYLIISIIAVILVLNYLIKNQNQ